MKGTYVTYSMYVSVCVYTYMYVCIYYYLLLLLNSLLTTKHHMFIGVI